MNILVIGGTGTISNAVVKLLSQNPENKVFILTRGIRKAEVPDGITRLIGDAFDKESLAKAIEGYSFDVACHFMGYNVESLSVAVEALKGRVSQFVFISTASAYQKPSRQWLITEETPLENPYWDYSRNKIACEKYLMDLHETEGFPVTVVRPSHTYCETAIPAGLHGNVGRWQIVKRMIDEKPIIVHGDGTALWTMTDSRDFAKGFVGLVGNKKAIGQAYHITSDESLPWNQIYLDVVEALSAELGREIKPVFCHVASDVIIREGRKFGLEYEGNLLGDKAVSVVFDNSKIKAAVPGFEATISHKEGTRRTIRYILSHPELQIQDDNYDSFCDYLAQKYS